ncbi:GNAT family N-acetyltransferase [Psychrobacter sp. CAL346-MNA-CIBAN-0220]|uniref:GNAT family N-acetyltransferase n=1 Tax=Psychrobacter sp. CAL346-MNA-CIBAN-0220 TaxID=3140457 RepID=UPI003330EE9D
MKVEKLSPDYANKISTLYNTEYEQLYLLGTVYQSPKLANYLKFICEENLEEFFGIVQNEELMAVVQYREADRYLHITHIVVSSSYQGIGLGKLLLSWVIKQAELNGLNLSLDVDSCNVKAFNWYLATGFEVCGESRFSVFKLDSKNPSLVKFHDNQKYIDFGISNAHIEDMADLEFFVIEPSTFLLKNPMLVEEILLDKLHNTINGFLVVDSNSLSKESMSTSIYDKLVFRMLKNII